MQNTYIYFGIGIQSAQLKNDHKFSEHDPQIHNNSYKVINTD